MWVHHYEPAKCTTGRKLKKSITNGSIQKAANANTKVVSLLFNTHCRLIHSWRFSSLLKSPRQWVQRQCILHRKDRWVDRGANVVICGSTVSIIYSTFLPLPGDLTNIHTWPHATPKSLMTVITRPRDTNEPGYNDGLHNDPCWSSLLDKRWNVSSLPLHSTLLFLF